MFGSVCVFGSFRKGGEGVNFNGKGEMCIQIQILFVKAIDDEFLI